jgi:hypothetical protein
MIRSHFMLSIDKATLKNPNVSEGAKENAQNKLDEMSEQVCFSETYHPTRKVLIIILFIGTHERISH